MLPQLRISARQLLVGSKTNVRETLVRRVVQEAQNQMRSEIFDRFDRVLVFNRLSYEVQIDVGPGFHADERRPPRRVVDRRGRIANRCERNVSVPNRGRQARDRNMIGR